MRKYAICCLLIVMFSCPAFAQEPQQPAPDPEDPARIQLLTNGVRLMQQGQPQQAMQAFDTLIAQYNEKFKDETRTIYSSRSLPETLLYLLQAAAAKSGTGAVVVSPVWSLVFYYKGYCSTELGRAEDAKLYLDRAIAMSPMNALYLTERGNMYAKEKDWASAMEKYRLAEEGANVYSPAASKNGDLARVWRSKGFVLVEQHQLDEAEKLYLQCLSLDPNDQRAANELKYVQNLKAKAH